MTTFHYDAIFVLDRLPAPNDGGAPSYNYSIVESCARAGWKILILIAGRRLPNLFFSIPPILREKEIDLEFIHAFPITNNFYTAADIKTAGRLMKNHLIPKQSLNKKVVIESFPASSMIRRTNKILDSIPARMLFVDTIFRDPYVESRPISEKRILIAHDIFHERVASFEANGFNVSPRITAEDERRRLSKYDVVLAISDRDAATLKAMAPNSVVKTVFPAASGKPSADEPNYASNRILYLGTKAHHNVDGLSWFLRDIWPQILQARSDAVLDVVGTINSALGPAQNVVFHGSLDDFSGIARNTAFAINPVRMGSGIKVKMVDYFRANLGCITTPAGALGFPEQDRPFVTCETASEFAHSVTRWLSCAGTCEKMSEIAQKYMRNFSHNAIDRVIRELHGSHDPVAYPRKS